MTRKLGFIAWELAALTGVNMEMRIEPYNTHQLDAVIRLLLRAWSPVFDSIQKVMDIDVYREFYRDNWRVSQQKVVEDVCAAEDTNVWIATNSGFTVVIDGNLKALCRRLRLNDLEALTQAMN